MTFDDGPESKQTLKVLSLLEKYEARATFFVVANRLKGHSALIDEILSRGHTIGNHSWDHTYKNFFSSFGKLDDWVKKSVEEFSGRGIPTVGFRPPAGVVTPNLIRSLGQYNLKLYLWNQRYFDTQFVIGSDRAKKSLERYTGGDIVLLHDRTKRLDQNLDAIETILREGKLRGYAFSNL
ncbi:MAG: polysaccharide deacetylase family protein [Bdellovibrionales bacterium]|nr:polysaccharide deacetylase family protein [Bdellovibrionales bacterium]